MKVKFKNLSENESELSVYGEIIGGSKWDDSDVVLADFKNALDPMKKGDILNLYVNSPGGSVFVASAIASMLDRARNKGIKIRSYIDGIAASAASFLIMASDEIVVYKNSMMMIHKPMCGTFGNANDLQKDIETLNKIENDVMLPLYRNKLKIGDDELVEMINAETWMNADEIDRCFDVTLLDEELEAVAVVDKAILKNYKNVPTEILESEDEAEMTEEEKKALIEEIKKAVLEEIKTEEEPETEPPAEEPAENEEEIEETPAEEEEEPEEEKPEEKPEEELIDYSTFETRIKNLKKGM